VLTRRSSSWTWWRATATVDPSPTCVPTSCWFSGDGRRCEIQWTIGSTETVELLFREVARPTLVSGPKGADLPTSGRFWISPSRGTVVRSEVRLDFGPEAEAVVSTEYRPEATLAMWVPGEMKERYADLPNAKVRTFPDTFTGVARYAKFRKFTVSSRETATAPAAEPLP
jgi:hypothetical protein